MKWPRVHYGIEPALLKRVRLTAGEERRDPGAVLSAWAELGRRAAAVGMAQQIEASYAAQEQVK